MVDQLTLPLEFEINHKSNRKKFWTAVNIALTIDNSHLLPYLDSNELETINSLCQGLYWIDMVPKEYRDIYSALYDESKNFQIEESVQHKIKKDINRTFSLFERQMSQKSSSRLSQYIVPLERILLAASHGRGYCQGNSVTSLLFIV